MLEGVGIVPLVVPSNVDEDLEEDLSPEQLVMSLAKMKVTAVKKLYPNDYVLGADTVVYLGNEVLGKPKDEREAEDMLRRLSGKAHTVYTGVALYDPRIKDVRTDFDRTYVKVRVLEEEDIRWYVDTGEPMDKAGAYALQGAGAFLIERIEGDYTGVIGLPLPKVLDLLKKSGIKITDLATK